MGDPVQSLSKTVHPEVAGPKLQQNLMRTLVLVLVVLAVTSPAFAQSGSLDVLADQRKQTKLDEVGPPPSRINTVVLPPSQTGTQPRFGYRLIVGGLYKPSSFPSETWIDIACLSADPRVAYDEDQFGFSLVRVHALVYELRADGSLNTETKISTADTSESDEAICDLSRGVDNSFIEIPRTFEAAVVSLFSVGRPTQHVEVAEIVERALAR